MNSRPPLRDLLLLAAAMAIALCLDPDRPFPIDLCAFHHLTGLPCPGCGLTRAFCHALRGHWAASLSCHPAGLLAALSLAGWATWLALEAVGGRPMAATLRPRLGRWVVAAGVTVSIGGWIANVVG